MLSPLYLLRSAFESAAGGGDPPLQPQHRVLLSDVISLLLLSMKAGFLLAHEPAPF